MSCGWLTRWICTLFTGAVALLFPLGSLLYGQQSPATDEQAGQNQVEKQEASKLKPKLPDPMGLKRLSEKYDVWIDAKRKWVVVDGKIAIREGQLEMFACPKGSKEHESIIAVNSDAMHIHAGLLAIGAVPGTPVSFNPKYVPAKGPIIDVFVLWKNEKGENQSVRAQEWIKHVKTGKAMTYDWVFAGSQTTVDEATGKTYYSADYGDMICVSNFPTAMLDLTVESSQANAELLFTPFTERIPARDTVVRLVLAPRKKNSQ